MGALVLLIAHGTNHNNQAYISIIASLVFTLIPLFSFPYIPLTPIELCREGKLEECKNSINQMYNSEYDAKKRFTDVQSVVHLTDKYTISIFQMICCPPYYKSAICIGILIGISEGIINAFFEGFLCFLVDSETTMAYCQKQVNNPDSGLYYLVFANLLSIGPTLFYLYYLERIFLIADIVYRLWTCKIIYFWIIWDNSYANRITNSRRY